MGQTASDRSPAQVKQTDDSAEDECKRLPGHLSSSPGLRAVPRIRAHPSRSSPASRTEQFRLAKEQTPASSINTTANSTNRLLKHTSLFPSSAVKAVWNSHHSNHTHNDQPEGTE
ncbi:UNVERIFIED_CONTAM: hypothetical protein FKN15_027359 [Acipenser sinensis]